MNQKKKKKLFIADSEYIKNIYAKYQAIDFFYETAVAEYKYIDTSN